MTKLKKYSVSLLALLGAGCFTASAALYGFSSPASADSVSLINKLNGSFQSNIENYFDDSVVYKLPETVASNDRISVIVAMNVDTIMDTYAATTTSLTLSEYATTAAAQKVTQQVTRESAQLIQQLDRAGISYTVGEQYDTILSGFEIEIKAKDFDEVNGLLSGQATLIVGEVYEECETEVVTNDVDVYETGIFDSSASPYQGDGVVVAILDTGLDYTHTAFSVENFTTTNEKFTLENVSEKVNGTVAASYTAGLTGEDVYVSKKVPYAYDYADKDSDVFPINSEHGTHVAGIIAGKDDTITGVAPNAQLAIMKVFSDLQDSSKTSWILSALEDCVTLGVDVINMSLGSSCGFSREVDKENINVIYDSVKEAGISLITAASNDYNATYGSEKNGSNPLTSNPDSGTVGSPSTYDAALSVASVNGVLTPYFVNNGQIIYFNEATNSAAKQKDFVEEILSVVGGVDSYDFEYVTIPGVGRSSDYSGPDGYYNGKIVLVKRGTTTFEDKIRVALQEKGAAGVIIYNNVSGTISMSVGQDMGAACSISQDDGERLAASETGIITISRSQVAGPFMSDFSSWGPTSDLKIKPEITAHGGEILSSVPGQSYDRLSGTSMAAPNQSGATALIRQHVIYSGVFGNPTTQETTAIVNQLTMSTADIIYNKNGLPYSVRKQGAGLVNISNAINTMAYVTTYDSNGDAMDKTKLELGDDKSRTGVYEMMFAINNVGNAAATYDVDALLLTEGVSPTYTSHGDTTVTQDGYLLSGTTTVTSVSGGSQSGNTVTVNAGSSAKVTVKIVLSDEDKQYMDESFAYGMYVEGFITLTAKSGATVNMNVPMLAFYGDWTEAPIFDEEYYDTNVDEINAGLDDEDKLMADAYATRAIGGLYTDYIATLGTYYFVQDPSATQIAANKDYIAISNQQTDSNNTINSIRYIYAGLLRNAKSVNITIVEDSTGKEVFNKTVYNQRKSYSSGSTIYGSSIDVDFSAIENDLKNNTRYTVTATAYIDYPGEQNNVRNTFEFPLYIDFEAPIITDVTYRTEYDKTTKQTKLYADLSIYDNHYAMGVQFGQIVESEPGSEYLFTMNSFGKYVTPVYSSFNSTSTVTIELTDYISAIKNSAGITYLPDGTYEINTNNNSFIATCYDYAMNEATYEIRLPDEIIAMYFADETISLSPNETLDLTTVINVFPEESWVQLLNFTSSDESVASIVNQTVIAKASGEATVTAIGYDGNGNEVTASVRIKVLAEGEEGYVGGYTVPEVNSFTLKGYYVNKAFYSVSSDDREIGLSEATYDFGGSYNLSMYPSESVTLITVLDAYTNNAVITYKSSNSRYVTVTDDGTIVAQEEGSAIITVAVAGTLYSARVSVTVKDPFTTNSMYLLSYKGLGGTVEIPDDRGITTIYAYAFSNYEYVDKDLENGDIIDEEDPYYIKQAYIGEDTITKIIIPEGVTEIQTYAFAGLTALEEVVLPTTLKRIGYGAFYDCVNLKTINLENVQFINKQAFSNCALTNINLNSIVAIGDYTFENCKLVSLELPASSQSLGNGAFYGNENLASVVFKASKIKIGSEVFANCTLLSAIDINASVISSYAFYGCSSLTRVNLGKDVSVIGEFAFAGTAVSAFTLSVSNPYLTLSGDGALVYKGEELVLVAPEYKGTANTLTIDSKYISSGAFAGNTKIFNVIAPNVIEIGSYAFASCTNLVSITLGNVEVIGDYAFYNTGLLQLPDISKLSSIGNYAFARTDINSVTIGDNVVIGEGAFYQCFKLKNVTLGDNVVVGLGAFNCPVLLLTYENTQNFNNYTTYDYQVTNPDGTIKTYTYLHYNFNSGVLSSLTDVTIGKNAEIESYAFAGNAKLINLVLGEGAIIGDYAFFNAAALEEVDLSKAISIGNYAFSGSSVRDYYRENNEYFYAVEYAIVNGELTPISYINSTFAPSFGQVDLTSLTYLGEGAFAYNDALSEVILGSQLTAIPDFAFALCKSLEQIDLPVNISEIGAYAFYGTSLSDINLENVAVIGSYAFARAPLTEITLMDGVVIGEAAFYNCEELSDVDSLDKAVIISAYAFYGTALNELTLTDAIYIGDFAFANSAVTKVTFGSNLQALGENPFYGCVIETYGKEEEVTFNGIKVGVTINETYDISDTVKVIDGVLYQLVPNGMELISYPMGKSETNYTVEEGTVRIGANAFAGSLLQNVTLTYTLKAVGDKAFYGCENLAMVVFTSYDAPILEETYDESYLSYDNLPLSGYFADYEGLGISSYYMWNVTSRYNNFYFGANFIDYVGRVTDKIVMVVPANGSGYDTFILSQYFSTTVAGANAATADTLEVIRLINALPASITLSSEDAIVAARNAYNQITSAEQQALVTNYSTLTEAESILEYLKLRDNPIEPVPEPEPTTVSPFVTFLQDNMIGLIIAGVLLLAVIGLTIYIVILIRKNNKPNA